MPETPTRLQFEDFEIDVAALELTHDRARVPISPQAVRALILLVRNAGRLVTREELYHELWPEPDIDVDRGLNTLIRQIRIGLGDSATRPRFIRTYPRRGYRFLVELEAAPGARRAGRRIPLIAAAGVLILAGMLGVRQLTGPSSAEATSVAVDDLDPMSSSESLPAELRERYLAGLYLLEQPAPARRAQATAAFEDVIASAPDFAAAHAGLADALFWAGRLEDARSAADHAIGLQPASPRALIVRGTVRLVRDWDLHGAEADLREAVRLAATRPEPHHALAFALATAGDHAGAIRELDMAYRLDPVSAIVTGDLGLIHLYAGRFEDAADYCQRAIRLEPEAWYAVECAFDALAHLGRFDQARPHAERIVAASGALVTEVMGDISVADADATRRFRGWRADRARTALGSGNGSAWGAALALAEAGHTAAALDALERAAEERGMGFVTITIDPRFRPLWSERRFQALAEDLTARGFAPVSS